MSVRIIKALGFTCAIVAFIIVLCAIAISLIIKFTIICAAFLTIVGIGYIFYEAYNLAGEDVE